MQPNKKYASTQAQITGSLKSRMVAAGKSIPAGSLADDGVEEESHVTFLFGLTSDDPESVRRVIEQFHPISFMTNGVSVFECKDYDVLKIDIISPGAELLNASLAASCKHDNLHPKFHAHATIAYVKKGLGRIYCAPGVMPKFIGDVFRAKEVAFSSSKNEKTVIKLLGRQA